MKNAYQATIEKDIQSNFVRKLGQEEIDKTENDTQWYLPHHPVKHPHKPGKVRRVCNAASKFKGVSLKDKLLSGPDLLRNLVGNNFQVQRTSDSNHCRYRVNVFTSSSSKGRM